MRARWLPRSLAVRVTLLCGLIAVGVTGMLGGNYFLAARSAILAHADEQLIVRVERLRRLLGDVRSVQELRDQAMLLEALSGSPGDVVVLRRAGETPLVEVNPAQVAAPACAMPAPFDRPLARADVCHSDRPGLPRMHWAAGQARAGHDGQMVEVLAGHALVSEMQMIRRSRDQVLFSTFLAVLACSLLVYGVLRQGLKPLHRVAEQAARIEPINLAVRLAEHDAPLELQQMVAVFNAMLDRIDTGYGRLSQFSADLAHEIRTPVGALIGQTQVALGRTRTPEEYQQVLESNLEELNRLRRTVDDILFLAQADHATLQVERAPMDMAAELQRIADYFEGPADEAGLRLQVQASGTAWVNPALGLRALHNLVVNAVRYSTPGTAIHLHGIQEAGVSTIAVENQGLPIPAEQMERLFDRFYRAEAVRTRPADSSGLGLAIVKAIMDLHGGEVRASCSASGTIRFELRFPR